MAKKVTYFKRNGLPALVWCTQRNLIVAHADPVSNCFAVTDPATVALLDKLGYVQTSAEAIEAVGLPLPAADRTDYTVRESGRYSKF